MKKYINGKYVRLTEEEIQQSTKELEEYKKSSEYKQSQIEELKQKLADTDYAIIKIVEGVATKEEYSEIIVQRQLWREEINALLKDI